ncbi:MAG: acetylglutamate kinase [Bacteroides sp.]|nr:MAG: acetylglutamate kinase [Bacteroides sp.]
MEELYIIKIGGNIVNNSTILNKFLKFYAAKNINKILIHGGGIISSEISRKMNLEIKMINGRRITCHNTLKIVIMTYAGLINKNIVSILQKNKLNSIGLCGADGNLITSIKKSDVDGVNYGYVGKVINVSTNNIMKLLNAGFYPVIAPITHDMNGQLLNTNADSIASAIASALSSHYNVKLYYLFEREGVLIKNKVINLLNKKKYIEFKNDKIIHSGMIPKIDNSFKALYNGVKNVYICKYDLFYNYNNNVKTEILL